LKKKALSTRLLNALKYRFDRFGLERKGWKTDRKIVVFESDDWGSIRMASKEVFQNLIKAGIHVNKSHYCSNDSLASRQDMEMLFEVLLKFRDARGNNPVITANTIVANPDFEKIKAARFGKYFYEPFTETLKKYPQCDFNVWKEGMKEKLFFPQLHGREHLNVARWLRYLREASPELLQVFKNNMFALSLKAGNNLKRSVLQAFNADDAAELAKQETILKEGFDLFYQIFGYKSESFIAPNYIWHPAHEKVLSSLGVKYLQGNYIQVVPGLNGDTREMLHFCGERNTLGQLYLIRNCSFEPFSDTKHPWVKSCIKDISNAFALNKPAIISAHRVNFIGSINPDNRDNNLLQFEELLIQIIQKWPMVEFMNSAQLGGLMDDSIN
jgi:hypothetical protein